MLRQLFAVILVALAVSPFTAPFSTCDLAVVNPLHQGDSLSSAKTVEEAGAIPFLAASDVAVDDTEAFNLAAPSLAIAIGEAHSLVLRL